jgi:hypothetical protein
MWLDPPKSSCDSLQDASGSFRLFAFGVRGVNGRAACLSVADGHER